MMVRLGHESTGEREVHPVPCCVFCFTLRAFQSRGGHGGQCFSVGPCCGHQQQCRVSSGFHPVSWVLPSQVSPVQGTPAPCPCHPSPALGKHQVPVRRNVKGSFSYLGEVTACAWVGWGGLTAAPSGRSWPSATGPATEWLSAVSSATARSALLALCSLGPRQAGLLSGAGGPGQG